MRPTRRATRRLRIAPSSLPPVALLARRLVGVAGQTRRQTEARLFGVAAQPEVGDRRVGARRDRVARRAGLGRVALRAARSVGLGLTAVVVAEHQRVIAGLHDLVALEAA